MRISNPARIGQLGRVVGGRLNVSPRPARQLQLRSPADPDDALGEVSLGEDDVELAVAAARAAAPAWAAAPLVARLSALKQFAAQLEARRAELLVRLHREGGRPPWECVRELDGIQQRTRQILDSAQLQLDERRGAALRELARPLGVVAVLGPAMLPLSTSHTHLCAALAAGNCAVFKPSLLAATSAQLYVEAAHAAQLPPGVLNLIHGDDDVGRALAAATGADAVVFTGSSEHGVELRGALAARLDRKLILHLGAKNAAVVLADSDLDHAAFEVAVGAFLSAGQRCTATSRVIVERTVADRFLARLLATVKSFPIGSSDQSFMGPLLSAERRARFVACRDHADAEPLLIGEPGVRGFFVGPSIHLIHERSTSPYQRRELFGPDLAVQIADDFDEGLAMANDSDHSLSAALFTANELRWRRFQREVSAGAVSWNLGTYRPSGKLGFGGTRGSGSGERGGAAALAALIRRVSLVEGGAARVRAEASA